MEIHWQASICNPEFPVLDYLVRVEEKDEPNWWKNCTRFQTKGSSQMCVVNELRSGTVYIVQIAARNVMGYSPFTKTEAQTKKGAGKLQVSRRENDISLHTQTQSAPHRRRINYDFYNSAMFGL